MEEFDVSFRHGESQIESSSCCRSSSRCFSRLFTTRFWRSPAGKLLLYRTLTMFCMYIGNIAFTFAAEVDTVVLAMENQTAWWHRNDSGLLLAFSSGFYALGTFLMGMIADRLGGKPVFCVSLILSGILNIVVAFGDSPAFVLSFQALNIIIGAAAWGSMTNIVSHWFDTDQLALIFSLLSTSDELGEFFVDLATGNLLEARVIDWSGVFIFQGLVAVVVGLLLVLLLQSSPPPALQHLVSSLSSSSQPSLLASSDQSSDYSPLPSVSEELLYKPGEDVDFFADLNAPSDPAGRPSQGDSRSAKACVSTFVRAPHFWFMLIVVVCLTMISEFEDLLPQVYQDVFGATPSQGTKAASWIGLGASVALFAGIFYDLLPWHYDLAAMLTLNVLTVFCLGFLFIYVQVGGKDLNAAAAIGGIYGLVSALPYYLPPSIYSVKFGGAHFSGTLYGFFDAVGYGPSIGVALWGGQTSTFQGWLQMIFVLIFLAIVATVFLCCYQWSVRPTTVAPNNRSLRTLDRSLLENQDLFDD